MSHMPAPDPVPVIEASTNSSREVDVTASAFSTLRPGSGDWTPAVQAALTFARDNAYGGLFFPGLPAGADYSFFQPSVATANFDIRGLDGYSNLRWRGEGQQSRLCMYGDGRAAAWYLVHLRHGIDNFTFQDLAWDGRGTLLGGTLDEQTHLIRVGSSTTLGAGPPIENNGWVRNTRFLNCDFTRSHGAGIFAVGARTYADGDDVSGLTIEGGRFYNNGRSCIDGQRVTRYFQISGVIFEDGPMTTDQLLDFEGTGATADAASYWGIDNCTFLYGRYGQASVAITLGGISDAHPSYNLRFTNSYVIGGNVLCTDNVGLTMDNVEIEGNPLSNTATLDFNSLNRDISLRNVRVRRPAAALPVSVVFADATSPTGRIDGLTMNDCTIVQETDAPICTFENATRVKITNSRFRFRASSTDKAALNLAAIATDCRDWDISRNLFVGNDGLGALSQACNMSAAGADVVCPRYDDNHHEGVTTRLRLQESSGGVFVGRPWAKGNTGDGVPFQGLSVVDGVNIAGNDGADTPVEVIYAADSDPPFSAPDGSVAIRMTNSTKGRTRYTREAGNWGTGIIPASSADFTTRGLPAPTAGWRMQDASTPLLPAVGAGNLDEAGTISYQVVTPGWTELGVGLTETANEGFVFANQALYNPATQSVAFLAFINFISASSVRPFFILGASTGTALWVGIASNGLLRLNGGGTTVDGVVDHRRHVIAVLACYNRTAGRFRCFTPREVNPTTGLTQPITGTYTATPTNGSVKGFGSGVSTPPICTMLGAWGLRRGSRRDHRQRGLPSRAGSERRKESESAP